MSKTDKINPGDIVHLKSGGPRMTVEKLVSDDEEGKSYMCKWFKLNDKKEGIFFDFMLTKIDDTEDNR